MKAAIILGIGFLLIGASYQFSVEDTSAFDAGDEFKQIKIGFILDKAFYQKLNRDDLEARQYCDILVDEANSLLRPINVTIILSDVLIWKDQNKIQVNDNIRETLENLQNFLTNLTPGRTRLDFVILLSGYRSKYSISSYRVRICKDDPIPVVIRTHSVQAKRDAIAIVHELGHGLGASHDDVECENCIMNPKMDSEDGEWSVNSLSELTINQKSGTWSCLKKKSGKD